MGKIVGGVVVCVKRMRTSNVRENERVMRKVLCGKRRQTRNGKRLGGVVVCVKRTSNVRW
jgi:hypothetical protein